jgi:transposase
VNQKAFARRTVVVCRNLALRGRAKAFAVSAYLGLVPGENTTGGKQRLGSITKHGNAHARAMLVQSAWLILRAGESEDPLRRWATDLAKTRGKKIVSV